MLKNKSFIGKLWVTWFQPFLQNLTIISDYWIAYECEEGDKDDGSDSKWEIKLKSCHCPIKTRSMVPDQYKHFPTCCGNLPNNNDSCSQEQMLEKVKHDAVKCTDKTAKKIVFSKFDITENNNIQAVDTYHGNFTHSIDGDNPNFCIGQDVDENMELKLIYCHSLCKREPCIRYTWVV